MSELTGIQELMLSLLPEKDKAYVAGIVDGEGTIGLYKVKVQCLSPVIAIENTCKEVLVWINEKLGYGSIFPRKRKSVDTRKDTWIYGVYGIDNVNKVLEIILPFLIIKKRQAVLLKIYCDEHIPYNSTTDIEWEIYYDLKELNRTGK